ncbi:TspO and MBR related proteins [Cnuella takakiae]|uniref:TspO and MBR related proteins n=1 Tax=Cnuella takakiae TaxID=1302690 RepID=A0A1M5B774_9BACT|nr:TspO/MBR family protein [Cnuella takakiae]OLY93361.1 TspO protein [Cnuella takakiae]SHF38329.1 TspO and MBR related proteins [Cnuella takakiae]
MKNWVKLLISLALPQIAGISGALFTVTGEGSWYRQINRPSWNPPGWVFGPVWTLLYILMGIAFYLVWKNNSADRLKKPAMTFWIIQLVLNFFWTLIFFGAHETGWATLEIIVLWIFILLTILAFFRINKTAGWLMVPYLLWVSFATALTATIWQMNS